MSEPLDRRPVRPFSRTELVQLFTSMAGGLGRHLREPGALAEALQYVAIVLAQTGGHADAEAIACLGNIPELKALITRGNDPSRADMTDRECVTVLATLIMILVRMGGVDNVRAAFRWIADDDATWDGMAQFLRRGEAEAAQLVLAATKGGSA